MLGNLKKTGQHICQIYYSSNAVNKGSVSCSGVNGFETFIQNHITPELSTTYSGSERNCADQMDVDGKNYIQMTNRMKL